MNNVSSLEEEIFLEALQRPAAERETFVQGKCSGDSSTVNRVMALLEGYEENSAYLETPPNSGSGSEGEPALGPGHAPGDRISSYRLVEKIGEGGCGTVYRAEQDGPVRRTVALKVIKLGMDTREFIARFEAERQALALMDHPNIARVYDAGATVTGRPYFTMELVPGLPITRYCDQHRLSPERRLELFVSLCSAVQHAHQKGILHRDLKPSNILVASHDEIPTPKIIDFGIAKALHQPLTDKTLSTHLLAFVGTPAYTSPEQIDQSGRDVDTRSDIYSLGVLLYELLTGTQPFDRDQLARAGLEETRRIIREVEPPRPSARVAAFSPAEREVIAARRTAEPAKFSAVLRTDLDWIVMRCLEKNPARRYETASALAADVRCHLENEPVVARPPSSAYRIGKFIRRHRWPVLAAAASVVSLAGALVATRLALGRETAARERAVAAERTEGRLRREAEEARVREALQSSRALVDLASQRLTQGRTADALAYFVQAARQDLDNPTLAPRLASILTSRAFFLPEGAIARHPSPVLAVDYSDDGSRLVAAWDDGAYGRIDLATGKMEIEQLPTRMRSGFSFLATRSYLLIYCADGVIRAIGRQTGQLANEIKFDNYPVGCRVVPNATDLFTTKLSSNKIMLCDATSGRMIGAPIPYDDRISSGAKWLVSSDTGQRPTHRIRLRRTDSGNEISLTLPIAVGNDQLITSPDGSRMATLHRESAESGVQLQLWSLPDGAPLAAPQRVADDARWFFYSPAGDRIVCWGTDIELFDAETLTRIARLPAGRYIDESKYVFSPDGRTLVTWANTGTVDLWDLETGNARIAPLVHGGNVAGVSFSRDGKILLTSSDGLARVWNATTGDLLAEPTLPLSGVPAVALSPDGTRMTIGTPEGALHQFRLSRNDARPSPDELGRNQQGAQPLQLPRAPELPAPFLPGSPTRVLSMGKSAARVIDIATGREAGGFNYPEPIQAASVRKDARVAVVRTGTGAWQAWWLADSALERSVALGDAPNEKAYAVFSPARDRVVLSLAHRMRVWDLATGQPVGPEIATTVNMAYAPFANFSPDGQHVLLGSIEGQPRIWDAASGNVVVDLGGQQENMAHATFSPDGTRIVAGGVSASIRLFDAATGERLSPEWPQKGRHCQGIFSDDGKFLATFSADRLLVLRDANKNGAELHAIEVDGAIKSACFSPDNTRIVIGTDEGTAQVWDVKTGLPVTEPLRHGPVRVWGTEFSQDGNFVRTENSVGTYFHFWPVPPAPAAGTKTPAWLLDLAMLCSGKRVADDGRLEWAPMTAEKIKSLREEISRLPDNAAYAAWGRWFLADPATRSIAPGFSVAPADARRLREALAR